MMQEKAEEARGPSQGIWKVSENACGRTWAYPRLAPSWTERCCSSWCIGDRYLLHWWHLGALNQHFDWISLIDFNIPQVVPSPILKLVAIAVMWHLSCIKSSPSTGYWNAFLRWTGASGQSIRNFPFPWHQCQARLCNHSTNILNLRWETCHPLAN